MCKLILGLPSVGSHFGSYVRGILMHPYSDLCMKWFSHGLLAEGTRGHRSATGVAGAQIQHKGGNSFHTALPCRLLSSVYRSVSVEDFVLCM